TAAAQQNLDPAALKDLEARAKNEPNNIALWMQLGKTQMGAARGRDAALLEAALASFEHILKVQADEPRAPVYQGVALASQAGMLFQSGNIGEAQSRITRGFEAMDRGVKASPKDAELRRLRGQVNLNVPEFMGRTEAGVADLELVIADPSFEKIPANEKARTY